MLGLLPVVYVLSHPIVVYAVLRLNAAFPGARIRESSVPAISLAYAPAMFLIERFPPFADLYVAEFKAMVRIFGDS